MTKGMSKKQPSKKMVKPEKKMMDKEKKMTKKAY